MSPVLVVETADLAGAARELDTTGQQLWSVVASALGEAMSCTAMAGDDPAGLSWAAGYEAAAAAAATAAQDVINATLVLSGLLSATASNYARADAASTTGVRRAVADEVTGLPGPTTVTLATRFAGVGGGPPDAPFGWSHVEHYVRVLWPNGHQDRLLRAAGAWHRSAGALDNHAVDVELAALDAIRDDLPEWRDIRTACWSLAGHLRDVARAHRSLAQACEQFAHHLDVAHSEVEHEIIDFLAQSAVIEGVGALLSAFTFGLAEGPTQEVEGERIAATIARIIRDIAELSAKVREVVASLPLIETICTQVGTALHDLLGTRIVWAEVAGVPGLRVLAIARDGRTAETAAGASGEVGAVTRLTDDATLPPELRTALDSPRAGEWNDPATLADHFAAHASDFGATSESIYAQRAAEFFRYANRDGLPTKVDARGNIRIYDPETNTFGSFTKNGATRTFFKPSSPTYWARQKGVAVR